MNPDQLKAVFKRVLMGAAAGPLLLSGCGGGLNCMPRTVMETIALVDGGLPEGYTAQQCPTLDLDAGTADCQVQLACVGREPRGLHALAAGGGGLGDCLAR